MANLVDALSAIDSEIDKLQNLRKQVVELQDGRVSSPRSRRVVSPEAKARMAEAQRRRYAAKRAEKEVVKTRGARKAASKVKGKVASTAEGTTS